MRVAPGMLWLLAIFLADGSLHAQVLPPRADGERHSSWDRQAVHRVQDPPLGLPQPVMSADNPVTVERVALGRKLFFDRRLSVNNTLSCGMCHIPEQGFTNNELATPVGVEGRGLLRNAPTILNVAYAEQLFHDGRESSLEQQAILPLLAPDEMANPSAVALLAKLAELRDYEDLFERAFDGGPTLARIGEAIASWERTLLAADSPFDRWRFGGNSTAITADQRRGFELFVGQAGCVECHLIGAENALFTDQKFHDTGVGYLRDHLAPGTSATVLVEVMPQVFIPVDRSVVQQVEQLRPADLGRFEVTQNPQDKWRFKTPSLRNVAVTAPYMHDGSFQTLASVVEFYNGGGVPHRGLDRLLRPLELSQRDIASIVAFLECLTANNLTVLAADARSVAVGN